MLSVIIVIAIIVLSLILAGIGAYIFVHNSNDKEEAKPIIDVSGQYAAVGHSTRDALAEVKPSEATLLSWLDSQGVSPEKRKELIDQWNQSLEETIRTVDEGDKNGTATYRVVIGEKGKKYCHFVDEDSFITREQIRHHAELLPPYVLGCDCKLMPKQPWETPSEAGWKAVIPSHGNTYDVPDWRQLA